MARLMIVFQLVLGALIGLVIVSVVPPGDPFFLPGLISALFLYVALHEAGHAIAAVKQGFRILTFSVWPFALQRRADAWRIKWIGKPRVLGFVAADPVTADNLRRRMTILVAGGPIASALTALASALIVVLVRDWWPRWSVDELKFLACWSGLTFLMGLIPYSGRFATNDAARLQMLWKGNEASDRFCCLMLLGSASRGGVRARDWNPELIGRLPGAADGSPDWIAASLFRYNWLIDIGRAQDARPVLTAILDQELAPVVRETLLLQAVWFEAKYNHDLEAARRWMSVIKISNRRDDGYRNTLLRAQAGIAFLENRYDDAEKAARESLLCCDRIDDAGSVIIIRERTEELLAEIAEARSAQSVRASS